MATPSAVHTLAYYNVPADIRKMLAKHEDLGKLLDAVHIRAKLRDPGSAWFAFTVELTDSDMLPMLSEEIENVYDRLRRANEDKPYLNAIRESQDA